MAQEKNFRPQSFNDYQGQEKAKKILKIAIKAAQMKSTCLDHILISAPSGIGKAQPINTIIPTPNGQKRLSDLQVGDYVFDRCGNPTEVLGIFPQGKLDVYKVTFTDGRETYCNNQHLWSVYENDQKELVTYTLQDIINKGLKNDNKTSYRFRVPINHRLYYPTQNFYLHPYIIGAFLGDGCCFERQLTLSSENEEIPNHVAELLPTEFSAKPVRKSNDNYNWTFTLDNPYTSENGHMISKIQTKSFFKSVEKELCCDSYNKRIPEMYFYGSRAERLELLKGLLDTDGHARGDNGRAGISFTSVNLGLIQDVVRLVRELGFYAGRIREDHREKYKNGVAYMITIYCDDYIKPELFWLNRKKQILSDAVEQKKHHYDYSKMAITNIEKMPYQEEMLCIYVDNEEHLYLTNDCIVTHNTTIAQVIANESGQTLQVVSCPAIKNTGDMIDILQQVKENALIFFDEIHSISKKVQEVLFLAMETFTLRANIDGEIITQQLPHFTAIGATTDLSCLELPMRNRFQLNINLVPYDDDEMTNIVVNVFKSMKVEIDEECARLIAGCTRGVPRNANSYCRRVYDVALVCNDGIINEEVVNDTLDLMDINKYGLNFMDMTYLKTLYDSRKSTGLETLSLSLGTDKKSIEQVIEPYLMKAGYATKGPRGRKITQKGVDVVEECM